MHQGQLVLAHLPNYVRGSQLPFPSPGRLADEQLSSDAVELKSLAGVQVTLRLRCRF